MQRPRRERMQRPRRPHHQVISHLFDRSPVCAVYIEIYALQCLRTGYGVVRCTMIILVVTPDLNVNAQARGQGKEGLAEKNPPNTIPCRMQRPPVITVARAAAASINHTAAIPPTIYATAEVFHTVPRTASTCPQVLVGANHVVSACTCMA